MRDKKHFWQGEGLVSLSSSLLAILCGLLFGLIILLISNPEQALGGFLMILQGGFTDGFSGIGQMIYIATPIIMTGLSVGFAFQTGLFNIGAAGQFTAGAFAAVYAGVKWTFLPAGLHCLVALLAAALAGALWGLVPGLLKAYRNVNEVIASIMMNYIGMYLVNLLVRESLYDQLKNQSLPVKQGANLSKAGLDKMFPGSDINAGILIVIAFVVLIYIILNKTVFGYELKACGKNRDAAAYAGINASKNIVLSMMISGGLAGVGGALLYLAGSGKYLQVLDIIAPEGFSGISIALLGLSNPVGILFAGLFIGHITVGGNNMQLYDFAPEVIDMIIAAIIYCGALSLLFRHILHKIQRKYQQRAGRHPEQNTEQQAKQNMERYAEQFAEQNTERYAEQNTEQSVEQEERS